MTKRIRLLYAAYFVRALLGLTFLVSATAKLAAIDSFETYLFSTGFLELTTAGILSRIVIAAEYTAGILLVVNILPLAVSALTLAMLSAFLAWTVLFRDLGDCHCFGDLIEFNYLQSLLKSIVMIAALTASSLPLLSRKEPAPFILRRKKLWLASSILIPLASVFTLNPPDTWKYKSQPEDIRGFSSAIFKSAVENGELPPYILENERIICFFSVHCEYCRLSASRLATLRSRGEFSNAPVTALFGTVGDGTGAEEAAEKFLHESGLTPDSCIFLDAFTFLKTVDGELPLIAVLKDGRAEAVYRYRDLR